MLATKPNPCNCKHGGECIPAGCYCYCSHGFTGIKCEQQIRKALVVGGLKDFQIHVDNELVDGLDDHRCSPPAFPTPIMAATGQTDRDTVVVCGGATQIGKYMPRLSLSISVWRSVQTGLYKHKVVSNLTESQLTNPSTAT